MKKLILIGVAVGIASLAQAITTPLPISITGITSSTVISGPNAYIYQTQVTLDPTLIYNSATIYFTGVTFKQAGGDNTLNYDLLNGTYAATGSNPIQNTGETSDYFSTAKDSHGNLLYNADILGSKPFAAPYISHGETIYDTETWSTAFSSTAFTDIINDINKYGYFDLGLDPNCTYDFGTITISFDTTKKSTSNVPDQTGTLSLLGLTFVGLLAFRRKLCLN